MIWEGNGARCWQPGGQSLLNSRASSLGKGSPGTFSILLKVAFTSLFISAAKGKREQILSASVLPSIEADNCFKMLPLLASYSESPCEWGKASSCFQTLLTLSSHHVNGQRHRWGATTTRYQWQPISFPIRNVSVALLIRIAELGSNAKAERWISMTIPVEPLCPQKTQVLYQNKFWAAAKTLNSCCWKWCWVFLPKFLASPPEAMGFERFWRVARALLQTKRSTVTCSLLKTYPVREAFTLKKSSEVLCTQGP